MNDSTLNQSAINVLKDVARALGKGCGKNANDKQLAGAMNQHIKAMTFPDARPDVSCTLISQWRRGVRDFRRHHVQAMGLILGVSNLDDFELEVASECSISADARARYRRIRAQFKASAKDPLLEASASNPFEPPAEIIPTGTQDA